MDAKVLIIGAGPIGIEVAAGMKTAGVSCIHIEAGQLGETITRWPRHARFFSSPERCAIAGIPVQTYDQEQLVGEVYLAYLRTVVETYNLDIQFYERATSLERTDNGFVVHTSTRTETRVYEVSSVVLATGDMNQPNRLGIPGEELQHVSHYFTEPHAYFQQRLMIVGGRNSALEAALRCFRAGAHVSVSYRRPALEKERTNSRLHLELSILTGKRFIPFYPSTVPVEIREDSILLADAEDRERVTEVPTDFVLLLTGYRGDISLLEQAGAEFNKSVPRIDMNTMQTSVPGLYVAGTAISGDQSSYSVFVATAHEHTLRIVRSLTGRDDIPYGTVAARRYPFSISDIKPKNN
ncbi:MAG: NAD(P)-binding domain-containing protein [Spirochaetota bacterium]